MGRAKAFEAIVKGVDIPTPRVPESFKVLIKELASLGLNITPIGATIVPETLEPLSIEGSIIEKKTEEVIEKDALELQAVSSVETPAKESEAEVK